MNLKEAAILLVDDEPILREIMAEWLGRAVGHVILAADGTEALRLLAANKIDLIISDVRMPGMDGVALLQKINEAGTHKTRMILITGFSDLSLRQAHDMGAEAVLEKPINRTDLLEAAQRSLADPEELWRQPSTRTPEVRLHMDFESLDAALKEKRIAFGRRGFCVAAECGLHPGPLEFRVNFKADQRTVSGQGAVRWVAADENQAGIEITHIDDANRKWVIDVMERGQRVAFIPASTGLAQATVLRTA
jgi:CheY-like chemotaxis protein